MGIAAAAAIPDHAGMQSRRMSRPRVFDYIEAVARARSIRRAAEELNTASSAVNRMILDYERELGAPLFERHARGVRLTTAGEYVLAHIRRTAHDEAALRGQIDGLRGMQRGEVVIAAVEAAGPFLAAGLGAFHMEHRLICYRVTNAGSAEVVAAVEREAAEIGLALAPPPSRLVNVLASRRHRLHAFMADGHPLADRRRLKLSDCVGFPLALGDAASGSRRLLDRAFEALLLDSRPFLTSNAFALMIETTRHTDAICFQFLPDAADPAPAPDGGLRAVPVEDGRLSPVDLALIVHARRALAPAAALLADRLAAGLRDAATG